MTRYLDSADSEWFKVRLTGAAYCLLAAFALLLLRMFHLQIIQGDELKRLSENNCIRLQTIDPPRGLIFDRNKNLLVDNRPSFDLSIVLKDAHPLAPTVHRLAQYLGVPQEQLMSRIERKSGQIYYPILLKRNIGRDAVGAIEAHKFDLPGVVIEIRPRRHYIHEQSASHLLGYLSEINTSELKKPDFARYRVGDFVGKFGVEKAFENNLRGSGGGRQVEVNATGQVVRVLNTVPAVPGQNIFLTIDNGLQQHTEALMKDSAGAAVAIDPDNGQILAMVSSPSFNQNIFVTGMTQDQWQALVTNPDRPMQNKAVQGEYPPASTYKIITAAAGLAEGVVDANTSFFCPGYYEFGDRVFGCWNKNGHGHVSLIKGLAESCDVYFYRLGLMLGVDRLAHYAKGFGLGESTGIRLPHEASGLVPTKDWKRRQMGVSWQKGETLSIAIGQGYNLATPLQLAVMIAAVANGGTRYRPVIIHHMETADGEQMSRATPEVMGKLPVNPAVLRLVKKGLYEAVNGKRGTARGIQMKELAIAGKTGTAQVVGKKDKNSDDSSLPAHLQPHAWFVGYAPATAPKIAVAVIVEHGEHGSSAAAPIARDIIRQYLMPGSQTAEIRSRTAG